MLMTTNPSITAYGASTRPAGPVFIAWSTDPQGPQAVNGINPVSRSETAYVIPVQLSLLPPGSLPSGLISARMVESNANAIVGVFELVVPIPADSLRTVSIQYAYPGYSYPPSTGLPIEYWDWTAGSWKVGLYNATQTGSLSLPATAIEPASRVVRLRMPSLSRMGPSQIYLRGAF
jgi:hypothetical protein